MTHVKRAKGLRWFLSLGIWKYKPFSLAEGEMRWFERKRERDSETETERERQREAWIFI